MDPDTCLDEIIDLVHQVQSGVSTRTEKAQLAEELAEHIQNLDHCITGGFLPRRWKPAHERCQPFPAPINDQITRGW